MAQDAIKDKIIPDDNSFYRDKYHYFFYALMGALALLLLAVGLVLYLVATRPLPVFVARQADGKTMKLISFTEPNLLPETIIRFASKAAVTTYTFNYVNYEEQLALARPYFTEAGWADFKASISGLAGSIVKNQLFVSGVVSAPPVISNQGPLPGKGYVWRVQIPFLLTYQSSTTSVKRKYFVIVTIVRVPTSVNPQGIGIDQFVTA
jgi:intracellular multiplication protein IcmL